MTSEKGDFMKLQMYICAFYFYKKKQVLSSYHNQKALSYKKINKEREREFSQKIKTFSWRNHAVS